MLQVKFFILILFIPILGFGQSIGKALPGPGQAASSQAMQHIDSVVVSFKQGKWQQVVAMFDSIVSNNYFTNNQLYYAVSQSLEHLSGTTPEPAKRDSLLEASREIYTESVDEWGQQVMAGGVDLEVYSITDKAPQPLPGMKKFNEYLVNNMNYPSSALASRTEGKVYLQFVVNKDGTVDAVKVQKGLSPDCDREAIRLIKEGPRWKPGFQNDQPVFVRMVMPVVFNIRDYQQALKSSNTH